MMNEKTAMIRISPRRESQVEMRSDIATFIMIVSALIVILSFALGSIVKQSGRLDELETTLVKNRSEMDSTVSLLRSSARQIDDLRIRQEEVEDLVVFSDSNVYGSCRGN
jgi:hypothetical protein